MGASNEYFTCTMSRYSAAMFSWKKGGEPDSLEGQEEEAQGHAQDEDDDARCPAVDLVRVWPLHKDVRS